MSASLAGVVGMALESQEVLVTLPVAMTKYLRRGGIRREGLFYSWQVAVHPSRASMAGDARQLATSPPQPSSRLKTGSMGRL